MNAAMRIVRLFAPVHSPLKHGRRWFTLLREWKERKKQCLSGEVAVSRPDHLLFAISNPYILGS